MPKKKKAKTPQELELLETFKQVADASTRNEKVSGNRKLKRMERLLEKLNPIETQILELYAQKMDIIDEVQILRTVMVEECIHPKEYLVQKDDHIVCKFCNKRIGLPRGKEKGSGKET